MPGLLTIAGLCVEAPGASEGLRHAFAGGSTPAFRIVGRDVSAPGEADRNQAYSWSIDSSGKGSLRGPGIEARIERKGRDLVVAHAPGVPAIDAAIRLLLAEHLLNSGGLLVHGVAVAGEGRAVLFTGQSGAGKSTLGHWASLGGLTRLSDELVAVVPRNDGVFEAHGTPWNIGQAASAELCRVGLLSHAPEHSLEPVGASEVLRTLIGNVLLPEPDAANRARAFANATRLLSAVPSCRLRFARDAGVADALRVALTR